MTSLLDRLLKVAAIGCLALCSSNVAAVVVVNHTFDNAGRTSNPANGNPTSGATNITGLDADTGVAADTNVWNGTQNDWVVSSANGAMAGNAAGPAFFDAINVAGPVNGNALRVMNLNAGFSVHNYFPMQTLGNGDSLSLSFTIRTSGASPTSSGNNFGVGFFNSGTDKLTANSTSGNLGNAVFNDDVGYQYRFTASGASTAVGIVQRRATTTDPTRTVFNGPMTGLTGIGSPVAGGGIAADTNYAVTLTLTRSLDGLKNIFVGTMNGATQVFEDTAAGPLDKFDHLAIFFGSQWGAASPNQRANYVDDVLLTYTAIPEVSSFMAGAAAFGLVFGGSRLRRKYC